MQWISILVCSAVLVSGAAAGRAQAAPAKAPALSGMTRRSSAVQPVAELPKRLAGWVLAGTPQKLADPAQVDAANAAALREYGLASATVAGYKQSGETLRVRVLRFQDATGAFGAYSLYRQNGWSREEIGMGAASYQHRVLFWTGNTMVDADFSRLGPASAAGLRELSRRLPSPQGGKSLAPPVLADLPQANLDRQTTHYALGPAGYLAAGGVLPPELAGFDQGAETLTANYTLRSGPATLTIIDYPTPQSAAAGEARIRAYLKAGSRQQLWSKALQDSRPDSLLVRRSGPLVALVSGAASPDESRRLLAMVRYDATLTSVPIPPESEVAKTGRFLVGVAFLVLIGAGAAILLGFSLGGFRALYRLAHGKPASSVHDMEFISLHLQDRDK